MSERRRARTSDQANGRHEGEGGGTLAFEHPVGGPSQDDIRLFEFWLVMFVRFIGSPPYKIGRNYAEIGRGEGVMLCRAGKGANVAVVVG